MGPEQACGCTSHPSLRFKPSHTCTELRRPLQDPAAQMGTTRTCGLHTRKLLWSSRLKGSGSPRFQHQSGGQTSSTAETRRSSASVAASGSHDSSQSSGVRGWQIVLLLLCVLMTECRGGQQGRIPAGSGHLRRVVARGENVLAVWRDLDFLASRWELKVLNQLDSSPVLFILAQRLLLLVGEPGGDVLAPRHRVHLQEGKVKSMAHATAGKWTWNHAWCPTLTPSGACTLSAISDCFNARSAALPECQSRAGRQAKREVEIRDQECVHHSLNMIAATRSSLRCSRRSSQRHLSVAAPK